VNYSDFVHVTCICVEKFKLQLGYKFDLASHMH